MSSERRASRGRHQRRTPNANDLRQWVGRLPVDLLVFGPHPDDIEIGLGGTVARHAADGLRVGLCDLTAGRDGQQRDGGGAAG